jgi:hypothetical protein
MVHTALAAATTLVAVAFALATLERWLDRRAPQQLAWTLALGAFAAASSAQWAGAALGWDAVSFRVFYLFGPIVSVPLLALGTVYLLAPRRAADRVAVGVGALCLFSAGVLASAPLTAPIDPDALPQGSDVFGPLPRLLAGVSSGVAATVLLGGAVWSAARFARRRGTAHLAAANGLIGAGTIALSAAGLLNSVADEMTSFAISHVVGISLVFAGFLVTSPRRRPSLRLAEPTTSAPGVAVSAGRGG